MNRLHIFEYGCLGGAIGYALAYALPFFVSLYQGDIEIGQFTPSKVVGLLGIIPFYVLLGGAAALIFDPDTPKFAIISGLGFEGIFKSVTTRPTVKGQRSSNPKLLNKTPDES
jgi:hypothetical protein